MDITGSGDLGNANNGVEIFGSASGNLIGGESVTAGNVIAFNSQNGIGVANGTSNSIVRNSIHSNTLLGINLGSGANNDQNFPVLTSAVTNGGQITITGALNSIALTNFRIEFYSNTTGDPTGYGEGQTLIGISDVTTDGFGDALFSPTFSETVSAGSAISAIVSRLDGGDGETDTSEFAQNVAATAPDITSNLVMHLTLDDAAGGTASDATANHNDGTLNGGAAWTAGEIGGALQVDYTDGTDFVEVPNSATLENVQEGNYTLASWFRPDSTPPGSGSDADANYGILIKPGWHNGLYYSNDNRFHFEHQLTADGTEGVASTDTFAPGQFYHVAGVVDRAAGTVELYVNGVLQGTGNFTPGTAAREYDTETWKLGVANPSGGAWSWAADGVFDDVRIYSRALSATDISALVELSPSDSGTAVWSDSSNTPQASDWDGSSFGTSDATAPLDDNYRIIQGADAPTRDEKIVVGVDATGNVIGEIWDGTSWSAFKLGALVSETYWYGAEVAYEQFSGDAIVVFNDNSQAAGDKLQYRSGTVPVGPCHRASLPTGARNRRICAWHSTPAPMRWC